MLSRVADSIYWMNRYIERAEHIARFVDVYRHLMLDLPGRSDRSDGHWDQLVDATGGGGLFRERFDRASEETATSFLTFDVENPDSILSCLTAARENARTVRETITTEMWEQINILYHMVRVAASSNILDSPHDFFTEIKMASHLYSGVTDASVTHGEGWHFGRIGRMQERADKTSRILDATTSGLASSLDDGSEFSDEIQWSAVLKSSSAFEMYRRRHGRIEPNLVAGFLLHEGNFPRSIRYCLDVTQRSLIEVSGSSPGTVPEGSQSRLSEVESALGSTRSMCENHSIFFQQVINGGLHESLTSIQSGLNMFGEALFSEYFSL